MTHQKRPNNKGKSPSKDKEVHRPNAPKDHLEGPSGEENSFEKRKQELQDETQQFMYAQSSKFSSVARNLILGVIGTVWVLTYAEGTLNFPNGWLFSSLLAGLSFLLIDVIHYYTDSLSYNRELYRLDKYVSQRDLDVKHEPKMDSINKRSHIFIVMKFWVLILTSILFIMGLLLKTSVIQGFLSYFGNNS